MQIEGKLIRTVYNNSENGYTVGIFDTENGAIRIAGSFAEPKIGTAYRLEGKFTVHPKYGEQFSFSFFEELAPEGEEAVREFLTAGNIRGIGPRTASLLVDTFGADTLRIMQESPEKLLQISGIGTKTLSKIKESLEESREFAEISVKLRETGFEMAEAVRIYKHYGKDSMDIVLENPYVLVEDIRGITFPKADGIALKLGIGEDSTLRIESAIRHILSSWAVSGSTLMPEELLAEETARMLDTTREKVRDSLNQMVFNGELEEDVIYGTAVIYLYGYFHAEQRAAYNIKRLKEALPAEIPADIDNLIHDAEAALESGCGDRLGLSETQRAAVVECLHNRVSVITGGPGTGKTTILNVLVRIFNRLGLKVALAAPTGRAAKRMEEATGESAMTIHRLLEYIYSEDSRSLNFGRNEDNPLEQDVIIIDEASMLDIMLTDGLLKAVRSGAFLIFTGDADQLPSVGAGNVLRDMIASGYIATTRLTEIYRQSEDSRIVVNSHRINSGEYPEQVRDGGDFFIIHRERDEDILEVIKDMAGGRLERGFDFIRSAEDIQVLTPTKKGLLGAPNLNTVLQEVINPAEWGEAELRIGSKIFREGDRVMQLRNNYSAGWRSDLDLAEGEGIFNGDMGTVESINTSERTMVVKSDGRLITYSGEMFDEVDLAYAVTVHKSQGSEFPAVIIPAWHFPPMLMTRNLLYTAVTRGKRLVLIIGSPKCIQMMIDNNRADERYTGFSYRLEQLDYSALG